MNIIKKRTPKILSATCLSFALILGVPASVGGESLFHDSAFAPQLAQTEPFVDTLGKRKSFKNKKKLSNLLWKIFKQIIHNIYWLPLKIF